MITDYSQDIFFYCDIDIFILKPIHLLTNAMKENTIYAHIEGKLFHPNFGPCYSADFPASNLALLPKDSPGYSAGKFFIYGKELQNKFFQYIGFLYSAKTTEYGMLEQPFYNRALYDLKTNFLLDTSLLTQETVCRNNLNYNKDTTLFFDCCGVPGDDIRHLTKAIYAISLLNAGIY
jgi:hypothetical protein